MSMKVGGFVPITPIAGPEEVNSAVNALCDLVLRNTPNPRALLPAIEWAANEVTDNVELHASAETPGIFFAHLDVRRNRLEMAVVDQGIGIRHSLASAVEVGSDGEAISKALQRGVTRDLRVGQGNGLAGTREIVVENAGNLTIWSGDALFHIVGGQDKGFIGVPRSAGTGVVLDFDLARPVDLGRTFIAGSALDFVGAQAERAEEDGLVVQKEVVSTRARAQAAGLRRKILALLPHVETRLVLDFTGVSVAASSFMDELLGRLAYELGERAFRERIEIINMAPLVARIANVVVEQRLKS
jgi:anti-sigma regulatory factor (Ser/Thr protein kinase)